MQTQLALLREKINDGYDGIPTITKNTVQIGVDTRRAKLSNKQMAERYLKSVKGNPNIDINKPTTPRMTQKRETQSAEKDFVGNTLRRRMAGSEMQKNTTASASPSAYEWRVSEKCNDLTSPEITRKCSFVTYSDYPINTKETGVNFETIGAGELLMFFNNLPIFIDDNFLLQALRITDLDQNLEDVFSYSILANGHNCGSVNKNKRSVCVTFTAEDPVAQIDQFLRNNDNFFNKMVVTDAETIEAWGKRSKLLRETDMVAGAVREKNWLAKHIAWGTAGAALGLAAIGGIMIRNRDKLLHAAGRVKSTLQSCSRPACCDVNEEDHQDDSSVDSDAITLNSIHIENAESSSVVDSSDASTISEPDFSNSSSSSTERNAHRTDSDDISH